MPGEAFARQFVGAYLRRIAKFVGIPVAILVALYVLIFWVIL